MPDRAHLEAYLHEHIPLSRALGIRVAAAAPGEVRLAAPLAPNLNHEQTAFGGSLSAVAILAGWCLVWVRLRGMTPGRRIVIHSSQVRYLAPATDDFEAVCREPEPAAWSRFVRTLEARGRARIELRAEVVAGGKTVAEFEGRYVVLEPEEGAS